MEKGAIRYSHARRFDNRIIRSSTRLAEFSDGEMSDYYKGKIIPTDEALNILKVMSEDTWIINFPNIIVELITSRFSIALKAIEYVPSIYFEYNINLRNNKKIIRKTIISYKKHGHINEININARPLERIMIE